ncbi:MAG: DUF4097 domain-containing protein [bacterium]|nr:DUF4097 domain-containing protein [bacterium]
MGKGTGVVLFGIALSIAGAVIAGVNARGAYNAFKEIEDSANVETGHIDLTDNKKISVELDSGTLNIHHSTTTSYVDYSVLKYFTVEYDKESNEVEMKVKPKYRIISWLPFIGTLNKNTSKVDVYLTDQDYDAFFDLNAGSFNINDDFNFSSLTVEVSAGEFNCNGNLNVSGDTTLKVSAGELNLNGNLTGTKNAQLKVSAGDLKVKYVEAETVNVKISAGDINAKVKSDNITFGISAGDLDMDIVGKKEDYTINIKKSAGSCNIKSSDGGKKKLDGKISAGKATIDFVEE